MILIAIIALSVAALNVAATAALRRLFRGKDASAWKAEVVGFGLRAAAIFGAAHAVWVLRRRPVEVVAFILLAAVAQLTGQSWLLLRKAL